MHSTKYLIIIIILYILLIIIIACNTFSEYFIQLLHETSLGLYRIYEHNMRKIPQLIKSRVYVIPKIKYK